MKRRTVRTLVLDACTGALLVVAVALLARDRVLPALADRARLDPGDVAGSDVRFRRIEGRDTLDLPPDAPTLLVVFRSTCPVCEETAPVWRALAALSPDRTLAFGLDRDSTAVAWAAGRLPGVTTVVPLRPGEFMDRLRVRAVPMTLLFEGRRLALARIGPLQDDDRARIRRAFTGSATIAGTRHFEGRKP